MHLLTLATTLDATLQRFKESPGLYDDHIRAKLYSTEWRLLTYINVQEADQNLETIKKYVQLSMEFCNRYVLDQSYRLYENHPLYIYILYIYIIYIIYIHNRLRK